MPNFMGLFKDEVRRLARKEVKSTLERMRKDQAELRRYIAELKRKVAKLETENRRLSRTTVSGRAAKGEEESPDEADRMRTTGKAIFRLRTKLGLTQAQLAKLLGVSAQSVYQWERKGTRLRLRSATKAALAEVRKFGVREARKQLDSMGKKKK